MNTFSSRRMRREAETIEAMIRIYCRDHHNCRGSLCEQCNDLLDYARIRLVHCPFQEGKTTCGKCPVHCYKPHMREKIRNVMRYVGPRMMFQRPFMSFMHLLDGFRRKPKRH
ncbi:MAG: nitrous oxide-stimulated promoter family protein [Desulfobulbaceae bacterium]|nr:nitrous oxide-stimulated promoter family protein [Desulfobulbaceae bacterium]